MSGFQSQFCSRLEGVALGMSLTLLELQFSRMDSKSSCFLHRDPMEVNEGCVKALGDMKCQGNVLPIWGWWFCKVVKGNAWQSQGEKLNENFSLVQLSMWVYTSSLTFQNKACILELTLAEYYLRDLAEWLYCQSPLQATRRQQFTNHKVGNFQSVSKYLR